MYTVWIDRHFAKRLSCQGLASISMKSDLPPSGKTRIFLFFFFLSFFFFSFFLSFFLFFFSFLSLFFLPMALCTEGSFHVRTPVSRVSRFVKPCYSHARAGSYYRLGWIYRYSERSDLCKILRERNAGVGRFLESASVPNLCQKTSFSLRIGCSCQIFVIQQIFGLWKTATHFL